MRSLVLISALVVVLAALSSSQSLDSPSCAGWCGFFSSDRACQCNPGCEEFGDCCADFSSECADLAASTEAATEAPTDIEFVDDGQLGSHFDGGVDGTVVDDYADASSGDSSSSPSSSSEAPTDSEEPFSDDGKQGSNFDGGIDSSVVDEYSDISSSSSSSSSEAASTTESTAVVTDSEEPFSDDGKVGSNFDGGIDSVVSDEYSDEQSQSGSGSGDSETETEAASTVSGVVVTDSEEPFSDDGKVGSNFDGGVDSNVVDEYSDAPSADTTQASSSVVAGEGQGQAAADESASSGSSSGSSSGVPVVAVAGVIAGVVVMAVIVALVAVRRRNENNARAKASMEALSALNSVIATSSDSKVSSV